MAPLLLVGVVFISLWYACVCVKKVIKAGVSFFAPSPPATAPGISPAPPACKADAVAKMIAQVVLVCCTVCFAVWLGLQSLTSFPGMCHQYVTRSSCFSGLALNYTGIVYPRGFFLCLDWWSPRRLELPSACWCNLSSVTFLDPDLVFIGFLTLLVSVPLVVLFRGRPTDA